jgi:hypothetical protein
MRHLSLPEKTAPLGAGTHFFPSSLLALQRRLTGFCCIATWVSALQKKMPGRDIPGIMMLFNR